jgi:hemolysin-activating ACP:hemolysin acyltransferase
MDKAFVDALWLWTTVPPYASYPCSTISNRLLPAFRFGRVRPYYGEDGVLRAFATCFRVRRVRCWLLWI